MTHGTETTPLAPAPTATVTGLLSGIAGTGTDTLRGGYTRPVYSTAELDLRTWFIEQATKRGLAVETDRNGAIWAWWDVPGGNRSNSLVTGSHLDSVPGGGAFDGPLGVASALVAASRVDFWLAVRHPDDAVTAAVVESIHLQAQVIAAEEGCLVELREESLSRTVHFDQGLQKELQLALPQAPVLDTGAGHDAGVLAPYVPTAMVFVRNPSGVSHSPEEHVVDADAETGAPHPRRCPPRTDEWHGLTNGTD